MDNSKQALQPEIRSFTEGVEIRMTEDGKPSVFGYALKWGKSYDMGYFTEEIQRSALSEADMSDVRILFNHDPNLIIGRTKSGTATVGTDETGMWYRASIPDSPTGQNLIEALKRGDIDQSSWSFQIARNEAGMSVGDEWRMKDGKEHRVITKVKRVFDASPVTYPANPDTSVAMRSLEMAKRNGEGYEEMPPKAQAIEAITGTIECLNESVAELKGYADKMTMIASVNPDLSAANDLAALLNARADENTALVATLAAAIQALSTTENQRSVNAELTETYNLLIRALDRKAAIFQRKQTN
jgi:hypothetical protein